MTQKYALLCDIIAAFAEKPLPNDVTYVLNQFFALVGPFGHLDAWHHCLGACAICVWFSGHHLSWPSLGGGSGTAGGAGGSAAQNDGGPRGGSKREPHWGDPTLTREEIKELIKKKRETPPTWSQTIVHWVSEGTRMIAGDGDTTQCANGCSKG